MKVQVRQTDVLQHHIHINMQYKSLVSGLSVKRILFCMQ
jgi:hypothetical protein